MKDKLIAIIEKYDLLAKQMASPEIFSNQEKLTLIAKEHRSLEEIVIVSKKYISLLDQIADDRTILEGEDDDLKEIARDELNDLEIERCSLEEKLKILLLPKDPNDNKNLI